MTVRISVGLEQKQNGFEENKQTGGRIFVLFIITQFISSSCFFQNWGIYIHSKPDSNRWSPPLEIGKLYIKILKQLASQSVWNLYWKWSGGSQDFRGHNIMTKKKRDFTEENVGNYQKTANFTPFPCLVGLTWVCLMSALQPWWQSTFKLPN